MAIMIGSDLYLMNLWVTANRRSTLRSFNFSAAKFAFLRPNYVAKCQRTMGDKVVILIAGIFGNFCNIKGEFSTFKTGIPGGPAS